MAHAGRVFRLRSTSTSALSHAARARCKWTSCLRQPCLGTVAVPTAGSGWQQRAFTSSNSVQPWVRHTGEGGLVLRFGTTIDVDVSESVIAHLAALDRSSRPAGVEDALPTYASLFVRFDPLQVSAAEVATWCQSPAAVSDAPASESASGPRTVSIPVHYGGDCGPDLDEAARVAGLSSGEEVVRLHSGGNYRVYFLGFLGGFPYMGGLPAELAKVPRLTTPRQKLPKGTVGIAGGQTGVYTISTPGGWYCLGRTPMSLFNPGQDPPALLRAGDLVKFVAANDKFVEQTASEDVAAKPAAPWIEVLSPGPLTTVQDLGRRGYARHGVSRSGAADWLALRMGNSLLKNDESAAALEVMLGGMKVRLLSSCAVALTGADCGAKLKRMGESTLGSLKVNEVVLLQPGDELELGFAKDGMRTYLCVQGGVDVPAVLGSRATDIRASMGGFRGRSLQSGDIVGRLELDTAAAAVPEPRCTVHDPLRKGRPGGKTWRLRVLPGPADPQTDATHSTEFRALTGSSFSVMSRADRMAVCVEPESKKMSSVAAQKTESCQDVPYGLSEYMPPELASGTWSTEHLYNLLVGGQQMSEGCVSGTIQLPPDGNPVILLAEHQTTGGYKVPAVVIQADMWQVGQMRPGDVVRFERITPEMAVMALRQLREEAKETKAVSP